MKMWKQKCKIDIKCFIIFRFLKYFYHPDQRAMCQMEQVRELEEKQWGPSDSRDMSRG